MYGVFTQGADGFHWRSTVDTMEAAKDDMADALDNDKKDAAFVIPLAAFHQAEDEMPKISLADKLIMKAEMPYHGRKVAIILNPDEKMYRVEVKENDQVSTVYYSESEEFAYREAWKQLR